MRASIIPFLPFNNKAEEKAAKFHIKTFNGKLLTMEHYLDGAPVPAASILTDAFEILGMKMTDLNWGQEAKNTESVSFAIEPSPQEEIDHYWDVLIADGGEARPCGWLKDKYGVFWQLAPDMVR
ncbi:VOC family protein [Mucilaginibacter pedocola]|uniref:VOC family protein n=1 Tax=Mucilaginibacter pedocola TaxID=1792845 RepID=UPI0009932246|nr:VOC family protein [Mucilaginibacter pedocola]